MTARTGIARLGVTTPGGLALHAPPITTITSPATGGVISTTSVTVTWTDSSPLSRTVTRSRVRLLDLSGTVLYDSGILASNTQTHDIGFLLSDSVSYQAAVSTGDLFDMGVEDVNTFSVALADLASYPVLDSVGRVYDVAINGEGYMLFDNFDDVQMWNDFAYDGQYKPLETPRLATGETKINQAIEQYSFATWEDYSSGSGIRYQNDDTAARYWDSDGVEPFMTPGTFSLLNTTAEVTDTTQSGATCTNLGTGIYVQTGPKAFSYKASDGGSATTFSVASAGTVSDMTNDGTYWYACDGADVYRNSSAADPTAAWSTINITHMDYEGQRICGAYATSPSSTPNTFTTLNSSGAEEVPSGRLILPPGWTITNFTSTNGYVYFGARDNGDRGYVYKWQIGSSDTPSVAVTMPKGILPHAVLGEQGQVVVACRVGGSTSAAKGQIWRCPVNDTGDATPFLVVEYGDTSSSINYGDTVLGSYGRLIFWGWRKMDGTNTGLGCLDLASGGYSKYWITNVTGKVNKIVSWDSPGRVAFIVNGQGFYSVKPAIYRSSGSIKLPFVDGQTTLTKVYDSVTVSCRPLLADQTVAVGYVSSDDDGSYTSIGSTLSTAGATSMEVELAKSSKILGLQVTIGGDGTNTPTVSLVQLRLHPLPLADEIIIMPLRCDDTPQALNGHPVPDNFPGAGTLRLARLKSLVGSRVRFQDVDWAHTGIVDTWEVQSVRRRKWSTMSARKGKNDLFWVALVTLRRRAI